MKIRNKYVSNSSSCSYLVKVDLTNQGIICLKLNMQQKIKLCKNGYIKQNELNEEFYLTQYIYNQKFDKKSIWHCKYVEGQMNQQPYDYQFFNQYQLGDWCSVYLRRQHDNAKQMTFQQFVKYYKNSDLPQQFLVNHTNNGFQFKYVK